MFDSLGGIDFLLRCDFEPLKLSCKLSSFHSHVLLYWKLLYKHNFSPHSCSLWNNKYILINRKSVFFQDWMDKGVWSIVHIMDGNGNFLGYDDFCEKYNIICMQDLYVSLLKAVPAGLVQLIKGALYYSPVIPRLCNLIISGINFTEQSCNNKVLRTLVNTQIFPSKVKKRPIVFEFPEDKVVQIRTRFLSFPLLPKAKEVQFKIQFINDIYHCNEFLRHRFNLDCNECTFCETDIESLEHLFYFCKFSKTLWDDLYAWLSLKYVIPDFDFKTVKYLSFCRNCDVEFLINNIVILANYFINKCRFFNNPPTLVLFQHDLMIFFKSLKIMRSEKALKLCGLLKLFFND